MKPILIVTFVLISFCYSFGQTKNSELSGIILLKEAVIDSTAFNFKDTSPAPGCELEYLRYCLYKYKEQRKDGYFFLGSGCLLGLIAINTKNDTQQIFGSLACAAGAWGGYRIVSAERWIAQASIKPTSHGIGFVVEF